jgi:transposase
MSDATSVLLLEHEFGVLEVQRVDTTTLKVIIEQPAREGPCPECGVLSGAVKDRPVMRLKDLPVSGQRVELWWRKRRLICSEGLCPQKTFTRVSAAVRPRARVTERLRERVAVAIASGNRAVSEVAVEYGVSWPTAHKALVGAATKWLPEPTPTRQLGIDETRFRSVRWILDGITWKRSDPWLTSFVDCSRDGPGSLLGLAPGRTGACVREWLGEQSEEFRKMIKIVVIDPSAPYASGIAPPCRMSRSRSTSGIWSRSLTRGGCECLRLPGRDVGALGAALLGHRLWTPPGRFWPALDDVMGQGAE